MFITRKALPRRVFLRGLGATIALPLLATLGADTAPLADTPSWFLIRPFAQWLPHGTLPGH